jgi:hypothetical protein
MFLMEDHSRLAYQISLTRNSVKHEGFDPSETKAKQSRLASSLHLRTLKIIYCLGRYLLAEKSFATALPFLERAAEQVSDPAVFNDFGVAYLASDK